MSYKVLSLKYRPQNFLEVVGQEHVTQTLINAFKKDRVGQGYIFTGPRGVGKTTTARILAKGLNCKDSKDGNPCNKCNICYEITEYRNLDVLEIDGASNRGIEEIRNLRELIKFTPMNASYKIFIIDDCHREWGKRAITNYFEFASKIPDLDMAHRRWWKLRHFHHKSRRFSSIDSACYCLRPSQFHLEEGWPRASISESTAKLVKIKCHSCSPLDEC